MENILKCSFMDAFEAGLIDEILKTASGGKRVNNGKLLLIHPHILRLAKPNHRNRCMSSKCHNLVWLSKKKVCTAADSECLKCTMNYALHEFKGHNFATFRRIIWAVLYHHFNRHCMCGAW
jgi:hypothetical protein